MELYTAETHCIKHGGAASRPPRPALHPTAPPPLLQAAGGAATDPASCQTLADILARIPEAKNWTQLLRVRPSD